MKIYFDGTLVNQDYYAGIKKSAKAYDGKFKLGATVCKNYNITVDNRALATTPSVITIYETINNQDTLIDTLRVISIENVDNFTSIINAEDNMTLFNFSYDPSSLMQNNTISIADVLTDICSKAGVSLGFNPAELRLDKTFTYCSSGLIARNYLQFIGEYNCSNFLISPSGQLIYSYLYIGNLFDKDNANILTAYLNGTSGNVANQNQCKTLYIPCRGNTTYTISKVQSQRFAVGTTETTPANYVPIIDFLQRNSNTSITITTSTSLTTWTVP